MAIRKMDSMEKYRFSYAIDEFLHMRENIMSRNLFMYRNDEICKKINKVAPKYVDDIRIMNLNLDSEEGIFVQTAKIKDYVKQVNGIFGENFDIKELDVVKPIEEYSYNHIRTGYEREGYYRKMADMVFKDEKPYYKRDAIYGFDSQTRPFAVARQGSTWCRLEFAKLRSDDKIHCVAYEPLLKTNLFTGEVRQRFDKFDVIVDNTMMETMQKCAQAFIDCRKAVDFSKPLENKTENHHFMNAVHITNIVDNKNSILVSYKDWCSESDLLIEKKHATKPNEPLTTYDKLLCFTGEQLRYIPEGFPLENAIEGFINMERANEKTGGKESIMLEQLSKPVQYLYARLIDDDYMVKDSAIRLGTATSKQMNKIIGMDDAEILSAVLTDKERFGKKLDIFVQSDELSKNGKVIIGLGASSINWINREGSYVDVQKKMGAVDKLSKTVMRNTRIKKTENSKINTDFER